MLDNNKFERTKPERKNMQNVRLFFVGELAWELVLHPYPSSAISVWEFACLCWCDHFKWKDLIWMWFNSNPIISVWTSVECAFTYARACMDEWMEMERMDELVQGPKSSQSVPRPWWCQFGTRVWQPSEQINFECALQSAWCPICSMVGEKNIQNEIFSPSINEQYSHKTFTTPWELGADLNLLTRLPLAYSHSTNDCAKRNGELFCVWSSKPNNRPST